MIMLSMTETDYENWRDDLRCGGQARRLRGPQLERVGHHLPRRWGILRLVVLRCLRLEAAERRRMGAGLMRHYTKAEWRKIPEAYKGRWELTPLNLERVKSGKLPAEYIGKRNTIVNDKHHGTVLITEGAHFVIDE